MGTQTYTRVLNVYHCADCGMPYGISVDFDNLRREDGKRFYCPAGHSLSYHDTEIDKLRKEKERVEWQLIQQRSATDRARAEADHEKARVRGYQGALAKTKTRAAAGVCPAPGCKRSFANVAAHIQRQHPDLCVSDAARAG